MEELLHIIKTSQAKLIKRIEPIQKKRNLFGEINRNLPCVGILGERGLGKTTIMLQKLKELGKGIYILGDLGIIKDKGLFTIVHYFYQEFNEKIFFIDEIHEYPNREKEIKNILDTLPDVKIVFSGSSSLSLQKKGADLSRRVLFYRLWPLNFQEYLYFQHNIKIKLYSFDDIIKNYKKISYELSDIIKFTYLKNFMINGQYPYAPLVSKEEFFMLLQNSIKKIIFQDIPNFINIETNTLLKLQDILYFISQIPPSNLNYSSLARKTGIDPKQIAVFLEILSDIGVINLLHKDQNLSNKLRKEKKIFLGNNNLVHMYNFFEGSQSELGTVREVFIIDMLRRISKSQMFLPGQYDIIYTYKGKTYTFEIGGKNKRINSKNVFIIKDDILIGTDNNIPLYLFGLIREKS
ncbi:MAG: hypothetical protein CO170_03545 [candidate division SR1 bacterium CG_4_9_14_3_um_filter_40_9]|nr:MAG: hypothetical protein CO170_03545 [candidate division SR1 bacterium CG_4_9_14_3_um_filter_40_9]